MCCDIVKVYQQKSQSYVSRIKRDLCACEMWTCRADSGYLSSTAGRFETGIKMFMLVSAILLISIGFL